MMFDVLLACPELDRPELDSLRIYDFGRSDYASGRLARVE